MTKEQFRRIAANEVLVDNTLIEQCVVELYGDRVVNYYHFEDELPMTEWLGGTIILEKDCNGILRYHG